MTRIKDVLLILILQLHHVHFLYHPCPDFSPIMLCCCLCSTLRVTTFSRVGGRPPSRCCPGDGVLPQLLLQNNAGLDQYLWTSHLSSQLSNRWGVGQTWTWSEIWFQITSFCLFLSLGPVWSPVCWSSSVSVFSPGSWWRLCGDKEHEDTETSTPRCWMTLTTVLWLRWMSYPVT